MLTVVLAPAVGWLFSTFERVGHWRPLQQVCFGRLKSFLAPLVRSSASSFALTNGRSKRILADALQTAFDSASRRRGLLHHDFLPEGSGLIIAPRQRDPHVLHAISDRRGVR